LRENQESMNVRWKGQHWFLLLTAASITCEILAIPRDARPLDATAVLLALAALLVLRPARH